MNIQSPTIARSLITDTYHGTPLAGFTLDINADGDWCVADTDTTETFTLDQAAAALRCYADNITHLAGQDPTIDYTDWHAAAETARRDADLLDPTMSPFAFLDDSLMAELEDAWVHGLNTGNQVGYWTLVGHVAAEALREVDPEGLLDEGAHARYVAALDNAWRLNLVL